MSQPINLLRYKSISKIYEDKNKIWKWSVIILAIIAIALLIGNLVTDYKNVYSWGSIVAIVLLFIIVIWRFIAAPGKNSIKDVF